MSDKKVVTARLDIGFFVNCPHCGYLIELASADDTNGYDHNEGGGVVSQVFPDGNWMEEHEKFAVDEVECSTCRGEFNVKGLEW